MFEQIGTPVALVLIRETWAAWGLDAHCVYLVSEHLDPETGMLKEFKTLLDAHWQEGVAWACIKRWSSRYGVPIKAYVSLAKVAGNGK